MNADQKKNGLENTSRPFDIVPFLIRVHPRKPAANSGSAGFREGDGHTISEANTTILV